MIDLEIEYEDGSKKSYSANHVPASVIDEFKKNESAVKKIKARFSSDSQTLDGNIYTDVMEREFDSLEQLSVHLKNA